MSLNQLQTRTEASVPTVPAIDQIDHFRTITKAGGSSKATPAQAANLLAPLLAPLLGMDYSKLTEQIVPGEYWFDFSGTKKQVYTKSFRGTAGAAGGGIFLPITGYSALLSFDCYFETIGGGGAENMPAHFGGVYDWKYYGNSNGIEVILSPTSTKLFNTKYVAIAKYTK